MSSMKQLLESLRRIDEAGGRGPQEKTPEEEAAFKKEFPPLKIGMVDNSRWGKGRTIKSAMTSADGTVWRAGDGQIWNVKYDETPAAPTRSLTSAQPAQPEAVTSANGANTVRKAEPQAIDQQAQTGAQASMGTLSDEQVKTMLSTVRTYLKIPNLVAKENTIFKSLIGRALLESFDLKLFEDAELDDMNKIWPQLVKWAEANKTKPEAQEIEGLRDQVTKWQASKQQSHVNGSDAATRDGANQVQPTPTPTDKLKQGAIVNAPVTGSAALNPALGDTATTIAGGSETAAGGPGIVPAPEKKTIPDAQAVTAAGNHVPDGTDAQRYAAVNTNTGAMYNKDTIGPGSRDTGTDHRVADLQKRLGITPANGVYGDAEKKAVSALQQKYGITVDGKYGPDTKAAFEKEKQAPDGIKKGTGDQSANSSFPTNAADSVKPRPTDPLQAQAWDAKYASGWNADGSSKQSGTGDQPQNSTRPGMDPKGKPEVYDRQKQLADLGATNKDGTKLKTDGITGDDTRKAEKEFGYLIIDPKTKITVNGTTRPVNPADIKNIPTWIKAVKEKRKKIEEVPLVYMDIVKKQLSIKESYNTTGQMYNEDQTLARIIQLSR